jgi:large subunit ribosomal protein L10
MPNAQKEQTVAELRDIVAQSKGALLTDYRGLTVAEVTNFRKKLRAADAEYHIVKNTLFKIAVGEEAGKQLDTLLTGPTAVVFSKNDVVAPTKAVIDFLRDLKKPDIKLKGGWIDGKVYNVDQVTAISKLPPREQIISQLIGSLNAPAANLVGTLDNIIGEFVRTIQAIVDKQAAPAEEAPAAA